MKANMDACIIGGASVWVWQDGRELYRNHYGSGVSEKTIYRLASMTKPITGVAVLQQIEAGKLALTDPVDKFYPEFRDMPLVKAENGELVRIGKPEKLPTVLHLLTHTAGFGGEVESLHHQKMKTEDKAGLQRAIRCHGAYGIRFEPFSQVLYSGRAAFDILAGIVEILAQMPFDEYLQRYIFTPCGMTETTFAPTPDQWARMIPMHDRVDGKNAVGRTWDGCVFEDVPVTHFLGGAGLASTLEDYAHFARMLLQGGEFEGNRILKPETVALMATPHVPETLMPRQKRWGLSVKVVTREDYGRLPLGCFGWSGAYGTHFWVDPENKIGAIYMKNSRYDGGGDAITSAEFEEAVTGALI
jgi:CubicO group peptidase (beta-lactamase class C family)